jgi:hypothetical protein
MSVATEVFQGGFGLDVRIWRRNGIRGEVRDLWSGEPDFPLAPTGKTRPHNFFVGGGAIWHFSRHGSGYSKDREARIRTETLPDARGLQRFASDSTSAYNSESRRASSVEFPNRANSYASVN